MRKLLLLLMFIPAVAYGQDSNLPIAPPQSPQPLFIPRDVLKADVSSVPSTSDLTIEQLYTLINERDRQYQQRFEGQEKAVNAALIAAKEAVNAALAAAKEAVNKAETANEKRLDNQNEFRGQLKDQAATLLPRAEADIRFRAIEGEMNRISDAVLSGTKQLEGAQWLWGLLGALVGGIIAIITVGLSIRNSFPRKP